MSNNLFSEAVERRADYTFKYNVNSGRHGWLRLTPAYSVKLVREIIVNDCQKNDVILDPFSGTATTGLVAAEYGFKSVLFEINPFLIWFGNTKCSNFSDKELDGLQNKFAQNMKMIEFSEKYWLPPIHHIERWWHPETLYALASIRNRIVDNFGEPNSNYGYSLIWIAFARLIIETSAAAFNHISMSFKDSTIEYGFAHIKDLFVSIFRHITDTAAKKLAGFSQIIKKDARCLPDNETSSDLFDVVITSPPYPNRISYIRELRPYMYWVKFLNNGGDAGKLDWESIGGTWGTATSKLNHWSPVNSSLPAQLYDVCAKINESGDKNSAVMSKYVHKYFDDIYTHLNNLRGVLKSRAKLNYIVGNSSFYGNFVNTEKIIAEIMAQLGYRKIEITKIRRRNTKKGLYEFKVKSICE